MKDKSFKADAIFGDGTNGGTGHKKPKKGSPKPDKPTKFAKPQTVKMSKDERRMGYMRGKGLKVEGFKADKVAPNKGFQPAKNKFKS